LPAGGVRAIAQDRQGFLWLGTDTGLIRFDGFSFVTPSEAQPFATERVSALLVSTDGSLWVALGGAGRVGRILNGRVTNYSTRDGLPNGYIQNFLEDSGGVIWTAGLGGLARFTGSHWERVQVTGSSATEPLIQELYEDRQQTLWAVTTAGLYRRSRTAASFELVARTAIRGLSEDAAGTLWANDARWIYRRLDELHASPVRADRGRVTTPIASGTMLHDRTGALWVGTPTDGVWRVEADHRGLAERVGDPLSSGTEMISALFEDAEGTIWAATRGGLLRFVERDVTTYTARDGLLSNVVTSLETDRDGSVWIGTADGLQRLPPLTQPAAAIRYALPGMRLTAIATDTDRLWVSGEREMGDLRMGELRQGRYAPLPMPQGISIQQTLALSSDPDGGVWFCAGGTGPRRWSNGEITELTRDASISSRPCISLLTDRSGRLWIGFADGWLASYGHAQVQLYRPEDGLAGGSVLGIREGPHGAIWIASANGITRFLDGHFTAVTAANGLPGAAVSGIEEDPGGYLWCHFGSGILRLPTAEVDRVAADSTHAVSFTTWGAADGVLLASNRYAVPNVTRGGDGRVWFQAASGVAVIDPSRLRAVRPAVRVFIERATADGRWITLADNSFQTPARISRLQIDYGAISLTGASKVRFSYRLDGVDSRWIESRGAKTAVYERLPPGRYRFHVRALIDGFEQSASVVDLAVPAAFYATAWFYAACVAGLAAVVAASWSIRLRLVNQRHRIVLEERARIAREIHDTLLQSMAGVALKLEEKAMAVPSQAAADIRQLRRDVERHIVEARGAIAALRSPELRPDLSLVAALRASARELATGSGSIETIVTGDPQPCSTHVEQELLRVGEEAMRNAVRHAQAERILVELSFEQHSVHLRVSDDGKGLDAGEAVASDHWGLRGMRERMARIGGSLDITQRFGGGTIVQASVPLAAGAEQSS
jgi:signal transduction histidine kinase/ligand-binding sensor domain-containing protein